MKQRIIILAGLLPGLVTGVLGFANGELFTWDGAIITGIGAAVGIISAAIIAIVRSSAEEIVYTVLSVLAGVVGAGLTIAQLAGWSDLSDTQAGRITGLLTLLTAAAITILRGEVTSPANVVQLESDLAEARGD